MFGQYLNKLMIVYRSTPVQDSTGAGVDSFAAIGTFGCRIENLSGNELKYLQRNADEDFVRIYTTFDATVEELDIARITEFDGTVLREYEIRRIQRAEQTQNLHHIEIDAVSYNLLQTTGEPDFPESSLALWLDDGTGAISNPWDDAEIWSE